MATETISLTDMRPRLAELMRRANNRFDRFVITRRGRAEAVLLASDEFEMMLETLEILSDDELVKNLVDADEEFRAGGGYSLEQVRRELAVGSD